MPNSRCDGVGTGLCSCGIIASSIIPPAVKNKGCSKTILNHFQSNKRGVEMGLHARPSDTSFHALDFQA